MSGALISQLIGSIERSLEAQLIDNAVFLAEQLYYGARTDAHAQLLAKCYLRQQHAERAAGVLENWSSANARYLRAIALHALRRDADAELTLCREPVTSNFHALALALLSAHIAVAVC